MSTNTRRDFLRRGGALVAVAVAGPGALLAQVAPREAGPKVTALEDLMREHGLLARILLIYERLRIGLGSPEPFPAETLTAAADFVRSFVEDYHEKLEEDHVFPRFEKAGQLTDLVAVLRAQHRAGRQLTDSIKGHPPLDRPSVRRRLSSQLRAFVTMYRPHKAREDTVLFPAFHALISPKEYAALGDEFENREQALFGKGGFEKMVQMIAELEKKLGIYELAEFTPKGVTRRQPGRPQRRVTPRPAPAAPA